MSDTDTQQPQRLAPTIQQPPTEPISGRIPALRDKAGRWLPGTVPNPAGRPRKTKSLRQLLEDYGRRRDPATGRRRNDVLAEALWKLALDGNVQAVMYLFDRVLGKPAQEVRLAGLEALPLVTLLPAGTVEAGSWLEGDYQVTEALSPPLPPEGRATPLTPAP